jgi:integrase
MRGQPAKVLGGGEVRRVLSAARRRRYPDRNTVIVMLSVKAGLRACEIARLTWPMVTDARGQIGTVIELPSKAAKKGSGRRIPIHPGLHRALVKLRRQSFEKSDDEPDTPRSDAIVQSERGGPMTAKAIVDWFTDVFAELGLQGCSSHSGRRTFVTRAARLIQKAGGSLRDVQQLVGHQSIKTTQGYIDGDHDAQRRLIRML